MPDYTNYLITSNHPNPLHLEPGERRVFIVRVCEGMSDAEAKAGASRIAPKIKELEKHPEYLLNYFLKRKLGNYNAFVEPPMTSAKQIAISDSMTELERFCRDLREDPDQYWTCFNSITNKVEGRAADLGEAKDVRDLYVRNHQPQVKPSETAVGLALGKADFARQVQPLRTNGGLKRLWAIRRTEDWRKTPRSAWARDYDKPESCGPTVAPRATVVDIKTARPSKRVKNRAGVTEGVTNVKRQKPLGEKGA